MSTFSKQYKNTIKSKFPELYKKTPGKSKFAKIGCNKAAFSGQVVPFFRQVSNRCPENQVASRSPFWGNDFVFWHIEQNI